ncbi:MAG: hypothetical protein ABI758_05120 [Candidatus Woesebacteria bacterium]
MNETQFLKNLQQKAKVQASVDGSSPLPQWARPLASLVGLHYWQFLLVISCIIAIFISVWLFPEVYATTRF